jgi:hypothetical protein
MRHVRLAQRLGGRHPVSVLVQEHAARPDRVGRGIVGRIIAAEESTRHVLTQMLGPYDPGFDYGPWIAQTRREYIASVVQAVNKQVAVADAFSADWVTTSPFKRRLLMRRGGTPASAQALVRRERAAAECSQRGHWPGWRRRTKR